MKYLILVLMLCLPSVAEISGISKDRPKQFEVEFTIKYNSITLSEAAEKEKELRKLYKNANIDVKVNDVIYYDAIDTVNCGESRLRNHF